MTLLNKSPKSFIASLLSVLLVTLFFAVLSSIFIVLIFRWLPIPFSSVMIYKKAEAILNKDHDYQTTYSWIPLSRISPTLSRAVITSEDQRFYYHDGFDFTALSKTLELNRYRKRIHGASTISQQVAKNLFLWPSRTIFRKCLEVYWTVLIEVFWSKRRIMEVYLNIVELGKGVFGAKAAAQVFFGTEPKNLTVGQSALLAASLPNPLTLQVENPSALMRSHQVWIIAHLIDIPTNNKLSNDIAK